MAPLNTLAGTLAKGSPAPKGSVLSPELDVVGADVDPPPKGSENPPDEVAGAPKGSENPPEAATAVGGVMASNPPPLLLLLEGGASNPPPLLGGGASKPHPVLLLKRLEVGFALGAPSLGVFRANYTQISLPHDNTINKDVTSESTAACIVLTLIFIFSPLLFPRSLKLEVATATPLPPASLSFSLSFCALNSCRATLNSKASLRSLNAMPM